ncbi:ABC transporter ATP-binding protein [Humidisolicoccus flavus]|uniref:ABC transporter ATP-binding protein n=1 Tax=Humidisolicoccus flavus TaxID=3111414 RepID=UPI003251F15F
MNALELHNVSVQYGAFTAVNAASLIVPAGGSAAIVGESGSGKSTIARAVMGLQRLASGTITIEGSPLRTRRSARSRRDSGIQMIFQDPISSLNPRRRLLDIVTEPLVLRRRGDRASQRARGAELLERVGLDPARYGDLRAGQISGGQAQRVAIARALAAEPRILVCDEPVSALDVSVQATVLNLFAELREHEGLTLLFISHDLAVVRMIADHCHVMRSGEIVESGDTEDILRTPQHPYTQQLIRAAPQIAALTSGAS